jgi:hypothetical protein
VRHTRLNSVAQNSPCRCEDKGGSSAPVELRTAQAAANKPFAIEETVASRSNDITEYAKQIVTRLGMPLDSIRVSAAIATQFLVKKLARERERKSAKVEHLKHKRRCASCDCKIPGPEQGKPHKSCKVPGCRVCWQCSADAPHIHQEDFSHILAAEKKIDRRRVPKSGGLQSIVGACVSVVLQVSLLLFSRGISGFVCIESVWDQGAHTRNLQCNGQSPDQGNLREA